MSENTNNFLYELIDEDIASGKVVADEIAQNLAAMIGDTEDAAPTAEPKHPTQEATTKFTGLKFGPNYDPTK